MLSLLLPDLADQVSIGMVAPRVLPAVHRVPLADRLALPEAARLGLLGDAGQAAPGLWELRPLAGRTPAATGAGAGAENEKSNKIPPKNVSFEENPYIYFFYHFHINIVGNMK